MVDGRKGEMESHGVSRPMALDLAQDGPQREDDAESDAGRCTSCLVAAAFMLPVIPLEVDEVIAMAQHLGQSRRRGTSLWTAFWKGGPPEEEATEDECSTSHDRRLPASSCWERW